jgi:hypothetical protein
MIKAHPCVPANRWLQPLAPVTVCMGMQKQSRNRLKSQLAGMLVGLIVIGSILAVPSRSAAQEVIIRTPPPPARAETAPPPPGPDHVWDPGHWRWDGHGYVWVPGHYVHNPHHHARWIAGHWVERHGGWYWVEGHWRY